MNCTIYANINGKPFSIPLKGISSNYDIQGMFNAALKRISEEGEIDINETDQIYKTVSSLYNQIKVSSIEQVEDLPETDQTTLKEQYSNLLAIPNDIIPSIISDKLYTLSSEFKSNHNPSIIFKYDVNDSSLERQGYYDPEIDSIVINLAKSDYGKINTDIGLKASIQKIVVHEFVHSVLDKDFDVFDTDINALYKQVKDLFKSRGFVKQIEQTYDQKNTHVRIKEYLAETFTNSILQNKVIEDQKLNDLKKIYDSFKPSDSSEKSFYKFIDSTEFEDTRLIDQNNVTIIRNGTISDSKVQDSLKEINDRFVHNKTYFGDTKYDVSYEGVKLKENFEPISFQLQLGRLETNDILYVPPFKFDEASGQMVKDEDSTFKSRYLPIIYSYFDNKKGEQRFVLGGIKKKDGTYTKINISSNDVLGYRNNVGILKNSNVSQDIITKTKKRYNQDLVFDSIEVKKGKSLEGSDNDILSGNLITIDIKKGKSIISKEAIEFRMAQNEQQNNSLLSSISTNSIISYKIDKKTIHAPIVRALANGVEVLSSEKGTTYFIPFNKIVSVITLKEDVIENLSEEIEANIKDTFDSYYKSKAIRQSTFCYTDKTGKPKIMNNSKYDYNQIFRDETSHRKDLDEFLSKKPLNQPLEEYINASDDSKIKDYANVYLNRKKLIDSFSGDNIYIMYDYISEDGKQYTGKGKLIHNSKEILYVYTSTSNGGFIQKINLRNNLASRYNPTIRRILYDNSTEYNLTEQFIKQKKDLKSNFETMTELFSDKYVGSRNAKLDQLRQQQKSILHGSKSIPTSLSDYYYYEYFDDKDLDEQSLLNKKAFLLSRVTPGCIVFKEDNGYTKSLMVVGINDKTGAIIASDIITEAKGDLSYYNGNYIKEEIDPLTIKYIGYNLYNNEELGIEANPFFAKKHNVYYNKISEFNDIKYYNTKESVNKVINSRKDNKNLTEVELVKITDGSTGKEFYLEKDKLNKVKNNPKYIISSDQIKFGIRISYKDGSFLQKKGSDYFQVKNDISNKKKAYDILKEGDVLSLTDNYYNMIITNKLKSKNGENKYKCESFYVDKDGNIKTITRTITESNINDIKRFNYNRFDKVRESENSDIFKNNQSKNDKEILPYKKSSSKSQFSKQTSGYNKSIDNYIHIQALSNRLKNLYGINFKLLTSNEIAQIYDGTRIFSDKRAFLLDNEIIINSDLASLAEPLHELTHMILPQIKFDNPIVYNSMLNYIRNHPDYQSIAKNYSELSGKDLDEEVFCTIFGEYYSSKMRSDSGNQWNKKNKSWFSRVFGSIKQLFSKLLGINESQFDIYSPKMFMNMSFNEMMDKFGDNIIGGLYENMITSYNYKFNNKIDRMLQILYSKELINKECYG